MRASFLSAGSDSKLVTASDYLEPAANPHFLRLRLHVLLGILFGRAIVTTEGWSLDSLTFIRIAAEVARAMHQVRSKNRPAGAGAFNPIVMESKRDGNYAQILAAYAARRHDVRWSGFKPAIDVEGAREYLDLRMQECCTTSIDMPSHIRDTFGVVLGQSDLADDMGDVAAYFLSRGTERLQRVHPERDAFRMNYNRCIVALHKRAERSTGQAAELLQAASSQVLDKQLYFPTSSHAMAHANLQNSAVEQGFMRLINHAFLRTAADSLGSAVSTPSFSTDEETLEGQMASLVEQVIVETHGGNQPMMSSIHVDAELDLATPIGHHICHLHDWESIWEQVIRLALSREWLTARDIVVGRIAAGEMAERVLDEPDGQNLLSLLEDWVPQLVLRRSATDRCGIAIKLPEGWRSALGSGVMSGLEEGAKSVISKGAPFAVGAVAPAIAQQAFFVELSALMQCLVSFSAATSVALVAVPKASLFSPRGPFSSRSSVLDLVR